MDEAYWAERRIAAEREFPGSSYGVWIGVEKGPR